MNPKTYTVSVIMPREMAERLTQIAEERLTSRGQVARSIIKDALQRYDAEATQ